MTEKSTTEDNNMKEDKMTEFRTGLALLQNANKSVLQRGRLTRNIPIASLLALVISLAGCLAFCVLFHYALSGFLRQVNELVPIRDFVSIQHVNIAIGIIFSIMAVIYFIVGTISTKNIRDDPDKVRRHCFRSRTYLAKHLNLLAIMTGVTYLSVILWVHIFAVASIVTVMYVIFINATYKVCLLFNGKCIDFSNFEAIIRPLLPEDVPSISLNFCEAKRMELCRSDQNLLSLFIVANIMCLLALVSLIHFLMCMVANWKEQKVVQKSIKIRPERNIPEHVKTIEMEDDDQLLLKKRKAKLDKDKGVHKQDTVELLEDQLFERRRRQEAGEVDDPHFVKRLDSIVERYEDQIQLRRQLEEEQAMHNP